MKNKYSFLGLLLIFLTVSLGCGLLPNSGGGTNTGNQPANTAVNADAPIAKTGVAECDELVDLIARDMQNQQDDGYIAGKAREYALDLIKDSIRKKIEENQGDKQKLANDCRLIKQEYERNQNNQNSNQ